MAYKTRRETRYRVLLNAGCPKWEARPLSRIPQGKDVPYMKVFIAQRKGEYDRAIKQANKKGLSREAFIKQWGTHIKRRYNAMNWKHKKERWGATVAFRMIKTIKQGYVSKKPEYESPWFQRKKRWQVLRAKIDREYDRNRSLPRRRTAGLQGAAGLRGATGDRWV